MTIEETVKNRIENNTPDLSDSLALSRRAFRKKDVLTREQEIELCEQIEAGVPGKSEELIAANLRYAVFKIDSEFKDRAESLGIDLSDLYQEAALAMVNSLNTYMHMEKYREKTFTTHIDQRIRTAADRALRRLRPQIKVPVRKSPWSIMTNSLDDEVGVNFLGEESVEYESNFGLIVDPTKDVYAGLLKGVLINSLAVLNPREREVIELRHGLDGERHTCEEAGEKMDMCHQYVSRLEQRALRKLRTHYILEQNYQESD